MAYNYTEKHGKESSNVSWRNVMKKLNKIWKIFEIFLKKKLKISTFLKFFYEKTALSRGIALFSAVCKPH